MSQAVLPCTPEALNVPTFPVAVAARGLVELLDLQTCIAFVRVCSRGYSSSVLAIKIRERAETFARQRLAIEKILRQRDLAALAASLTAPGGLEGWTVVARTVPPPRSIAAAAALSAPGGLDGWTVVTRVASDWVVDTEVDLE